MKQLVMVGGLQFSGKSSLCRELVSRSEGFYAHVSIDEMFEHLALHRDEFLQYIKRDGRSLYRQIVGRGRMLGLFDPAQQLTFYANDMIQSGHADDFFAVQGACALIAVADRLKELNKKAIPVLESPLTDRKTREVIYTQLKKYGPRKLKLDKADKLLVYFDRGLELSLERFRQNERPAMSSMTIREEGIVKRYHKMELPTDGELPNLRVEIVRSEEDIEAVIARLEKGSVF